MNPTSTAGSQIPPDGVQKASSTKSGGNRDDGDIGLYQQTKPDPEGAMSRQVADKGVGQWAVFLLLIGASVTLVLPVLHPGVTSRLTAIHGRCLGVAFKVIGKLIGGLLTAAIGFARCILAKLGGLRRIDLEQPNTRSVDFDGIAIITEARPTIFCLRDVCGGKSRAESANCVSWYDTLIAILTMPQRTTARWNWSERTGYTAAP